MKKFLAVFMAALMTVAVSVAPASQRVSAQDKTKIFLAQTAHLEESKMQTIVGGDRDNACLGAGILIGMTFLAPGGIFWAGYAGVALAACLSVRY